ncbi:hypothetical protein ABZS66_21995 [Dactylosporangium sp. NPDC005572]|uniref:hypothetical protein n=1 Tax=Dactylosporangium sp. NPDC005572 TaxID=3156889 RepID=UPI0033A9DE82
MGQRGPNTAVPWHWDGPVSVLRLPLDVHDPRVRRHVERVFAAAFAVRRAVQRDARSRVNAFWAAERERRRVGPARVRTRLGLTRAGLERASYRHVDGAPQLRCHLTKALAMHLADGVWETVNRHLFADASRRRYGRPRVGNWWEFSRVAGRARSHTRSQKWETFRLVGTLAGHRVAFDRGGLLRQPRRMPRVLPAASGRRVRSWWDHDGAFAVVLTGTADRDLVLPVRLPQGLGRAAVVEHYLGEPERWHKVDLVRHRDPGAAGGWRYEAHLMILGPGHVSPQVAAARQAAAALHRRGGVDVNVSNIAVVSIPAAREDVRVPDGGLRANRVARTGADDVRLAAERLRRRRRDRALQRSRRAANPAQYQLSSRQQARAERRRAAGLAPIQVETPGGARRANTAGVPVQAFRRDVLSAGYQRLRARAAADGAARTRARRSRARQAAADIVAVHGTDLVVEDTDLRLWARRWGRALHAFSPGTLLAALRNEIAAVAPGMQLLRAGTRRTAWSQHCLCGARVAKDLRRRHHRCTACGLEGDRDLVAALIGAHTVLAAPTEPGSAHVDWSAARVSLAAFGVEAINKGLQGALSESCGTPPSRSAPSRCATSAAAAQPQRPRSGGDGRRARRSTGTSRHLRPVPPTTPDEAQAATSAATPERRGAHPGLRHSPALSPEL